MTAAAQVERAKRLVCAVYRVKVAAIEATSRSTAPIALARQIAIYLAHVSYGLSYTALTAAFDRDRATIGHAIRLVEDLRDDADFDRAMDYLERELTTEPSGTPRPAVTDRRRRIARRDA